ncbi:Protein of unknown function [Gryllus bimaculatus]|nr:Protein of unknown function [Gryllus bimaculatus]
MLIGSLASPASKSEDKEELSPNNAIANHALHTHYITPLPPTLIQKSHTRFADTGGNGGQQPADELISRDDNEHRIVIYNGLVNMARLITAYRPGTGHDQTPNPAARALKSGTPLQGATKPHER